jgi:hypothetical protein
MPKSGPHKLIGTAAGIIGAAGYGLYCQNDKEKFWQFALGGAIGGCMTARLADILEPSKTLGPNHRSVFHGIAFNGTVSVLSYHPLEKCFQSLVDEANNLDNRGENSKAFLNRLIVGFLIGAIMGQTSHLLADLVISKNGLPLLA